MQEEQHQSLEDRSNTLNMSSQGGVLLSVLADQDLTTRSTVKIKVGATLIDFQYDGGQDLASLKHAISAVTGISSQRMKIMVKGKLLKVSSLTTYSIAMN